MGVVANALIGVLSVSFGLIANIFGTLTGIFLGVAVAIFNWVTSEGFISLSYTRLDNPFIKVGWTLTRDLTNIFFVIALVVIGLGTALRLMGYQAQKTLPTLILIALLINFTPVILGLIVDASNIAMNFFIQGGFTGGNSFANIATSQWSNIGALAGGAKFWDPTASAKAQAAAIGSFVLIFFNLIAALIYLLFALIFILRYVVIWILVILSPFAFACYILPATRKIWSQWWNNFIQWSIIGVIAAFFLYLGDHFIRITTSAGFLTSDMGEISGAPGLSLIFNNILPYFISIIFLFIGLFASLTFAPQGAKAIIQGGQRGIIKASKIAGKQYWQGTKKAATALPRSFAQGMQTGGGWKTRSGWASGFRGVGQTLTPPRPIEWLPLAKTKAIAAGRGLKKAAGEVWREAIGKKPKKKPKGGAGKKTRTWGPYTQQKTTTPREQPTSTTIKPPPLTRLEKLRKREEEKRAEIRKKIEELKKRGNKK